MVVEVRLFAVLREQAGSASVEVELPDGARVRDAIEQVGQIPGLGDSLDRLDVVMAVNREYADPELALHDGDELALIPPVSGGATASRPEPKTDRGRAFWSAVDGEGPRPPCAELLGWNPIEMEPGHSLIEFEAREQFLNHAGVVQGGFLAAMLDDTMGPAAVAAHAGDAFTPTLELKVSFLRPAFPGKLIARGRVVRMGRSIVFLAGTLSDGKGNVVATATATSQLVQFDSAEPPMRRDLPAVPERPTPSEPLDRSFEQLVVTKAGGMAPAYLDLLGERPLEAAPGTAKIEFFASEQLLNPNGVVQGGFLAAMLDETMGPAGFTLVEPGQIVPTIELKTSFLRPAIPGRLVCEASVIRKGGSVVFTEATLSDDEGVAVATATGSALIVPIKDFGLDG